MYIFVRIKTHILTYIMLFMSDAVLEQNTPSPPVQSSWTKLKISPLFMFPSII